MSDAITRFELKISDAIQRNNLRRSDIDLEVEKIKRARDKARLPHDLALMIHKLTAFVARTRKTYQALGRVVKRLDVALGDTTKAGEDRG